MSYKLIKMQNQENEYIFDGKSMKFHSDQRVKKRSTCEHILICLHFISENLLTFTDQLLMSTTCAHL